VLLVVLNDNVGYVLIVFISISYEW